MEVDKRSIPSGHSLEEIGDRLRRLREGKGWTQEELAAMLHLSRSAWKAKEEGRGDLKTDLILQLSQLFSVTADYILTGIEAHNAGIAAETGLQEAAINFLRHQYKNGPEIAAVNMILGERRGQEIIDYIWTYLQADFEPPLPGILKSGRETDEIIAIGYWAKTEKEGEQQFMYVPLTSEILKRAEFDRIFTCLERWKAEIANSNVDAAHKRERAKEVTTNAPKE